MIEKFVGRMLARLGAAVKKFVPGPVVFHYVLQQSLSLQFKGDNANQYAYQTLLRLAIESLSLVL